MEIVTTTQHKIGSVRIKNNLILSPMHGVSCNAFRLLCKNHGAGLIATSMIHPESLFVEKDKAEIVDIEHPIIAQIVGKDPVDMVKAAQILEEKADIIDINLGCPDKNVLFHEAGAFLVKHPEKMIKTVSPVVSSVNCPVTAKIRMGWDESSINAVEVCKKLEDCGVEAVSIHGRTREQGYRGEANWDIIRQVKEKVNIKVIANGDVFHPEQYLKIQEATNADFVMIARGAIGNPQIFENCIRYSEGKPLIEKDIEYSKKLLIEFLDLYKKYSTRNVFSEIRCHAMWLVKGVDDSHELKVKISKCKSIDEVYGVF